MNVYTGTGGLYILHHHVHHRRTTPHKSSLRAHSSLTARTATSSRRDHPPSSDRSKSTSPIGPPGSSVDAPTISKNRSEPPKIRPLFPITPETPTRNPPCECQPYTAPHRRQLLHPAQHRPPLGEDLDSYHVRAIYAALDVSGVRGDGYKDGKEITHAQRRGGNRSLVRLPPLPGPSLPGEELTTTKMKIL